MQTTSQTDPLARTFASWARHGRPAALAHVFEATAPGLLRVARHLTDEIADAEDLLQSTFVTAMAKARDFDPERPLLPWLNGILQRHAQRLKERARRRPDPERIAAPAAGPDPVAAADREEIDRALARAIDDLPAGDRALILLELRHGLAPAEIAEVLDRAPGTVRVQLHRARERLRRLLPAGVGSALALGDATLRAARGLAAIRGEVLALGAARFAAAGTSLSAAWTAWTMQVLWMKATTKVGLVAAGLFLLAVGAGVWAWSDDEVQAPGDPGPRDAGALAAGGTIAESAGPAVASERRQVVAADANQAGDVAAGEPRSDPVLTLQLSTWVFRRPLVGVPVLVEPQDGRLPALHARIECTDDEGIVVFEGLPPGRYNVIADRSPRLDQIGAAPSRDIVLATIHASAFPLSDERLPAVEMPKTQDLIRYDFLDPRIVKLDLAPGEAPPELHGAVFERDPYEEIDELVVDDDSLPDVSPMPQFDVDERTGEHALDRLIGRVEIRDEDVFEEYALSYGTRVKGRVETPEGEPVAGARIGLLPPGDNEPMPLKVVSGSDGRFRIRDLQPGVRLFAFGVEGHAPGRPVEVVADGKLRILALGPAEGAIRGVVRDDAGNPVAGAMVRIGRMHAQFSVQRERTDASGRFGPVWVDTERATVLIQSPGREPWAAMVVAGREQPTVVEATMRRGWRLTGRVVSERGEPMSGMQVLARVADRPRTEARTDDAGRYALECLPAGEVELRVPGGYWLRGFTQTVQGGPGEEHEFEIQLAPAGRINLHVTDERGTPLVDWVVRIKPASEPSDAPTVTRRIDEKGKVSLETWPNETYRLTLQPDTRKLLQVTRKDGEVRRYIYVPSMAYISGADRRIAGRDVGFEELPGVLDDGRIVVPDRFLPTARLTGRLVGPDGLPRQGRLWVDLPDGTGFLKLADKAGRFDSGLLIPGPYSFALEPDDDELGEKFELEITELAPEQRIDLGDVRLPR